MSGVAIIGGSGLESLEGLAITRREHVDTAYGEPSSALMHGTWTGRQLIFLARHGEGHTILPHRVNYCANLAALQQAGITQVVAVFAVGGISEHMPPGRIIVPDQLIDYTWSRRHTVFEDDCELSAHTDFTEPYCAAL